MKFVLCFILIAVFPTVILLPAPNSTEALFADLQAFEPNATTVEVQIQNNTSIDGDSKRKPRQLGAMFSKVATGILEGISGTDVSLFFSGIKSLFGHQSNAKVLTNGHSRSEFDETAPLVSFLNTIITGQVREQEEEQTVKIDELLTEETIYFREDQMIQKEALRYEEYIFWAFIFLIVAILAGFVYQIRLIRN